ncbi:MAG: response regulator [Hyphomonadaceae bacterium]|nr:response regulator [Hyphomonadaceae bacterium]
MTLERPRILIVEDDYLIALDVEQELLDRGYAPIGPAADLETALEVARTTGLSAAVLDMNLGNQKSFPVARELQTRGVPTLFLSGNDSGALPEDMIDYRVLSKPVDYDQLDKELRKLIAV